MPKPRSRKRTPSRKAAPKRSKQPQLEIDVRQGDNCLTAEGAKKILGWEEEGKEEDFGDEFLFRHKGRKIRCTNNLNNRPLYRTGVEILKQEILRKRWKLNGEAIIIGDAGSVLNGQHTMVALILAAEQWLKEPDTCPHWKSEPTIDKVVITGVHEDDSVVNTMDTCKPRSLSDVVFRSGHFSHYGRGQHKHLCRTTEYATRLLRERITADVDAHTLRRTNSEGIDFINGHPTLLEMVAHVYDEHEKSANLKRYLPLGYMSAMAYLFAASEDVATEYLSQERLTEDALSLIHKDKAKEFVSALAKGGEWVEPLNTALQKLMEKGRDTLGAKTALMIKTWAQYLAGKPLSAKALTLHWNTDGDQPVLMVNPHVGGLDAGIEKLQEAAGGEPTAEEIRERARALRGRTTSSQRVAVRRGKSWDIGDTAWVQENKEPPYFARLIGRPYAVDNDDPRVMVEAEDAPYEVRVSDLHLTKPEG